MSKPSKPSNRLIPTLKRERELWTTGSKRIAGVDEVGVGPLCAAVVAAAVELPPDVKPRHLKGVRDSKMVATEREREELAEMIRSVAVRVGVGAASPKEIDRINVWQASGLAMQRALRRLPDYEHAFLDGRWHKEFDRERHTFIVDGDALCLSISAASLIAKVTRDRLLVKLAARYPQYGWERNRGYATPDHLAALRLHGPTVHHRHRYRPVVQSELFLFDDEVVAEVTEETIAELV